MNSELNIDARDHYYVTPAGDVEIPLGYLRPTLRVFHDFADASKLLEENHCPS
ncbi:hypothetical protein [Arcanobacterium canis]